MPRVDYAKLDYDRLRHHRRYVAFVNAMPKKLTCQACGGEGSFVDDVVFGHVIRVQCDWCEGTGLVTPYMRCAWLRLSHKQRKVSACQLSTS